MEDSSICTIPSIPGRFRSPDLKLWNKTWNAIYFPIWICAWLGQLSSLPYHKKLHTWVPPPIPCSYKFPSFPPHCRNLVHTRWPDHVLRFISAIKYSFLHLCKTSLFSEVYLQNTSEGMASTISMLLIWNKVFSFCFIWMYKRSVAAAEDPKHILTT